MNNSKHNGHLPKIVSLFSGAGGLDWGFHKAGFKIQIAIDKSPAAIKSYNRNHRNNCGITADLVKLGLPGLLEVVKKRIIENECIGLIGGPPCQGFSRANPKSHAEDPRNELISQYLDIIGLLQKHYTVEFVIIENVLGIRDKKHREKYNTFIKGLKSLNFDISENELCALDFGVPQLRKRLIICAMRKGQGYSAFSPKTRKGVSSVLEAIGELPKPIFYKRNINSLDIPYHPNHWTMNPKSKRFLNPNINYLNGRSFRCLSWTKPSPTIAFGHREIYVHPNGKRRLSIYEAMLLQGFPYNFVLEGNLSSQVEQVSNAVPPPLARSIANAVKHSLEGGH